MAPEQIMGRAGTAADIFSWAVTVAYAASGQSPFGAGTPDAILYRIVHETPDIAAVPAALHAQVAAALAKEPYDRPTAPELLSQLTHTAAIPSAGYDNPTQTVLAQTWRPAALPPVTPSGPAPPPAARPAAPQRTGLRRPVLLTLVLAVAILLGAGGAALAFALSGHPSNGHNTASGGAASHSPTAPATSAVTNTSAAASSPAVSSSSTSTATSSTSPSQATSSSSAALPVLVVGSYSGMQPTEIAYSGDGTNVVTGITWSSWAATGATGTGTSDIDSCVPSCAAASPDNVSTTITLSTPVNGHFTQMTETRNGSTANYTYPDTWAQSAS
jgi:hypothetical protein